jgi:hypothetical protein
MSFEIALVLVVFGMLTGFAVWKVHQTERRYQHLVENLLLYGRPTEPVASVYDPGPADDETRAMIEMQSRALDRATEYLMQEGQVSQERARAEAERLLAVFEQRGIPE